MTTAYYRTEPQLIKILHSLRYHAKANHTKAPQFYSVFLERRSMYGIYEYFYKQLKFLFNISFALAKMASKFVIAQIFLYFRIISS